jgi:hypothetical protein
MEAKFTKGKWIIEEKSIISSDLKIYGNIICDAPVNWEGSMKNWDANAKLIASAPEMFEMLKDVLDTNKEYWGEDENRVHQIYEIEQLLTKITE